MRTYTSIIVASLFLLQHAAAQPTVDIDEPDRASLDRLEEVDGKWVIELSTPPGAFDDHVLITIKASTEEPIGSITVDAQSHPKADVQLAVRGKVGSHDLPSVDLVTTDENPRGWVILLELKTSGDLGAVNVADLGDVDVKGDLTGDITLTNPAGEWGSPDRLKIWGDMLGDFTLDNGVIKEITVSATSAHPPAPSRSHPTGTI